MISDNSIEPRTLVHYGELTRLLGRPRTGPERDAMLTVARSLTDEEHGRAAV